MVNWGCRAPEIKKRKKSGASKGKAIELTLGTLGGVPKGAFTGSTEKIRQAKPEPAALAAAAAVKGHSSFRRCS
ncbi:hypothetical protein OEZ86_014301 [Tetradesmus obliquus]|nr:hypothetical protein OEZ86_014301 [Tetradesmus obliquus]